MRYRPVLAITALIGALTSACQPATTEPASASATASARPSPPHFATAVCGQCHAIGPIGISPDPEAPTFAAIVNRPGLTRDTLFTFLRDAHNYPEAMQFFLDDPMAGQLTDYMLTLKDPDFRPSGVGQGETRLTTGGIRTFPDCRGHGLLLSKPLR